jgi:hypothetical protein
MKALLLASESHLPSPPHAAVNVEYSCAKHLDGLRWLDAVFSISPRHSKTASSRRRPRCSARRYRVEGNSSATLKPGATPEIRTGPRDVKNDARTDYVYENKGGKTKCQAKNAAIYTKTCQTSDDRQKSGRLIDRICKSYVLIASAQLRLRTSRWVYILVVQGLNEITISTRGKCM